MTRLSLIRLTHIIAIRHGGATTAENLALACIDCNQNKGADLTTLDPLTGEITPLFHTRHHDWNEHFQLEGALIRGRTATGRATVALLRINELSRVEERQLLLSIDRYPS